MNFRGSLLGSTQRKIDWGLLVIRVGIGIMFMLHGDSKLFGGPDVWVGYGERGPGSLGIAWGWTFLGISGRFERIRWGLLLLLGFLTRPALVFLMGTMVFAAGFHIIEDVGSPYHAIESLLLFTGLFISGPGRYSLDETIFSLHYEQRKNRNR